MSFRSKKRRGERRRKGRYFRTIFWGACLSIFERYRKQEKHPVYQTRAGRPFFQRRSSSPDPGCFYETNSSTWLTSRDSSRQKKTENMTERKELAESVRLSIFRQQLGAPTPRRRSRLRFSPLDKSPQAPCSRRELSSKSSPQRRRRPCSNRQAHGPYRALASPER